MFIFKLLAIIQIVPLVAPEAAAIITDLLGQILEDYDPRVGPWHITGEPLPVSVGVSMNSIGPFNEDEMTLGLRAFLRMSWKDPRLAFENDTVTALDLPGSSKDEIWTPDLYFPNARSFQLMSHVKDNAYIRVDHNGDVLMSLDVQMENNCPMALYNFPFDSQRCAIPMESYRHTTDKLLLQWQSVYWQGENMKQFTVASVTMHDYTLTFTTGEFSDLEIGLTLHRSPLYFLLQLFFPAAVIVFISWIPLWMPRRSSTLRPAIGTAALLAILVVCNMANTARNGRGVVTSADYYLAVCFMEVVGALITCLCQTLYFHCWSGRKNYDDEDYETSSVSSKGKRRMPKCDMIMGIVIPTSFILYIALGFCYMKYFLIR